MTMDRVSGLPQAIIHHHIFPFLPNKDIKLTTCLSKTWYHLSNSFPYLHFSNHGKELEEDEYLKYVDQALQRFVEHSDGLQIINKLSIASLVFRPRVAPLVDSWIRLVLRHGVEEFNLDITKSQGKNLYDLPRAVFNANSMIRVASIKGCSLLHLNYVNDDTNLIMRKLHLERLFLGQTTLSSIISGCPLIEELSITSCTGMVRISNLRKLKSLVICNWERVGINVDALDIVIDEPSLQNLEIQGLFSTIRILGHCPILTDLKLKHIVHELELQVILQDILPRLPFLRRLSLVNIDKLTRLKVSSDSLNKLTILGCQKLVELQIDAPNLLNVVYKGVFTPLQAYSSRTHQTNVTSARWCVTTSPHGLAPPFSTVEVFLVEVSKFVSKMKHIECLDLNFAGAWSPEINLIRGVDQSPVAAKIDNLRLRVESAGDKFFERYYGSNDFFDIVVWICRPHSLHLELTKGYRNHLVKRIREIIMGYRGGDCGSYTFARRFWLHCLEDVMHVTKDGTENRLLMEDTFVPLCSEIKFIFNWADVLAVPPGANSGPPYYLFE